jgi:hypothetical protein
VTASSIAKEQGIRGLCNSEFCHGTGKGSWARVSGVATGERRHRSSGSSDNLPAWSSDGDTLRASNSALYLATSAGLISSLHIVS